MLRTLFIIPGSLCALLTLGSATGHAQSPIPQLQYFGPTDSSIAISAGQANESLDEAMRHADSRVPNLRSDYPEDSIRATIATQSQAWLTRLDRTNVLGIQLDPLITALVIAGKYDRAESVVGKRLATPGLSVGDRAYTLLNAIQAFAAPFNSLDYRGGGSADSSAHSLTIAEKYLRELNTLGPSAATHRYMAELTMVTAYDAIGRPADVARHGEAEVHLLPLMPVGDRWKVYSMGSNYPNIARAVIVQPAGRDTLAVLNRIFLAATAVPTDSVAMDSSFAWRITPYRSEAEGILRSIARVGDTGIAVYSNRWINLPDTTAHAIAVHDGRIRIVEVGSHTCPECVLGVSGMQRLTVAHPAIQAIDIDWTIGAWANRVVSADEEAVFLTNYWVHDRQIHIPVALYLSPKKAIVDGSLESDLSPPFAGAFYQETTKPQFYILDGQGRIRATFAGYTRTIEREIERTIRGLEQEAHRPAAS